jgi:UTP--glucose-1-phosphate uridylyltransferase
VYQNKPDGTGDAVLKCKRYLKGTHFLMLLADDLILRRNCSKEMIALHKKTKGSVIASKKVKKRRYLGGEYWDLKRKVKILFDK